jgi:hypothetical protein
MKVQRVWRTEVEVEMAVAKLLNVAQLTFNWSLTVDKNKTGSNNIRERSVKRSNNFKDYDFMQKKSTTLRSRKIRSGIT